jgi:hypothetical protein
MISTYILNRSVEKPGIRNCCFASDFRTALKRQNTALNNEVLKFEFRDPEGVSV